MAREPSNEYILTTEPAVQFYSGNHLDGVRGKAGAVYHRRTGFYLENLVNRFC